MSEPPVLDELREVIDDGGRLLVLTGAGISAESGIPTFRGPEGYWTVGSETYQPQELATWSTFSRDPQLVWPWYLWRRKVCQTASPNPAHTALVTLEQHLGERFTLVTQNVDGLHARAGSGRDQTYEIHGNIDYFRCVNSCGPRRPVADLPHVGEDHRFRAEWAEALECSRCRTWMRPHVLWFDECYDENNYRFDSAVAAAAAADALLVVGTTGTTSLPAHILQIAKARSIPVIDINPGDNPFAKVAVRGPGTWVQSSATAGMDAVLKALSIA